jgi:N-acetylmuramoyl-L-alanine amidase
MFRFLLIAILLIPVPLVADKNVVNIDQNEAICLAKNIYHEARGEPKLGKLAVAQVTLNRTKSRNFPKTICSVVYQKYQFSWTLITKKRESNGYKKFLNLAYEIIRKEKAIENTKILYFHNKNITPKWAYTKQPELRVGNHIFYR